MPGLLGAILEIVGEFLIEMLFGLAAEAMGTLVGRLKLTNPMVSAFALALVGAAAGFLSWWLFPHRLNCHACRSHGS